MAEDKMTLLDVLCKGDEREIDFLRQAVHHLVHGIMEQEVSAQIGAERYERTEERSTSRNGVRRRLWDTRVGTLDLGVPKLRSVNTDLFFPKITDLKFPSWALV